MKRKAARERWREKIRTTRASKALEKSDKQSKDHIGKYKPIEIYRKLSITLIDVLQVTIC